MTQADGERHLITSEDWSIEQIDRAIESAREMRDGEASRDGDACLARKTVALYFNKPSTRSRISLHSAVVEMGGVPMTIDDQAIHPGEGWTELSHMLVNCCAAICARLWEGGGVKAEDGEPMLREMAAISDEKDGPPVISMGHGRCHPCQGMYEYMTFLDALGGEDLAGRRIAYMWTRGNKDAPLSPTLDSLMMMTRRGANVTLCHPAGRGVPSDILEICHANAANAEDRGGGFTVADDLSAVRGQEIVYARHWGAPAIENTWSDWYCGEELLGDALFTHPMPVARDVEASAAIVDDEARSLLRRIEKNKYFLQKAVLMMLVQSERAPELRWPSGEPTEGEIAVTTDVDERMTIHPKTAEEDDRRATMNSLITTRCLDELRPQDANRILDVGCRDGEFTIAVAEAANAAGSRVNVVGIDRDPDYLETARKRAKYAGLDSHVEFRRGDPTDLRLGDDERGAYNLAYARFVLEHETRPGAVVEQMMTAVCSGGRIVLADDDHDLLRLWPEPYEVMTAWNAYVELYERRGRDPYVGRRLVELLHEAGAKDLRNAFPFVGACAGQKRLSGMVENLTGLMRGTRGDVIERGLIDAHQFDDAMASFAEWSSRPDATIWWGISWAEGRRQ